MKKKFWIISALILILLFVLISKFFLIGEPVDGKTLIYNVEDAEKQLTIRVFTTESATAFTEPRLLQQGTTLNITFSKVLPSPIHTDGELCIYLEKCDLTNVILCGEPIWSAQ